MLNNDGKYVIAIPIIIFDIETETEYARLKPTNQDEPWYNVDCNADFTCLAALTNSMEKIYLYNIHTPEKKPWEFATSVYDLIFSPKDSNLLASCWKDAAKI